MIFEIPSRVGRRTPIIPMFRKLRQEAHGFRTNLEHTELVQGQPGLIMKPQPETQTFELSVYAASSLPVLCRLLLGFGCLCSLLYLFSAVGCCWGLFLFCSTGDQPQVLVFATKWILCLRIPAPSACSSLVWSVPFILNSAHCLPCSQPKLHVFNVR